MEENRSEKLRDSGIVLIGCGGMANALTDVIDAITSYSISQGGALQIAGYVDYDTLHVEPGRTYVIAFGSLKNLRKRQEIYIDITTCKGKLATIIAPTASVSKRAKIERGTVIMHNAHIGPDVTVGENVLINTGAIVEHDSAVGAHSLVLTNATINGNCVVGQRCMIGSGAVLLHGITLADDVIVGAGAVVTRNLLEPGTYMGIPARKRR